MLVRLVYFQLNPLLFPSVAMQSFDILFNVKALSYFRIPLLCVCFRIIYSSCFFFYRTKEIKLSRAFAFSKTYISYINSKSVFHTRCLIKLSHFQTQKHHKHLIVGTATANVKFQSDRFEEIGQQLAKTQPLSRRKRHTRAITYSGSSWS